MDTIKKYIVVIAILFLAPELLLAQNESRQNLHFIYIDHEVDTPVNQLCRQLKDLCNDALETEDPLIIYLSTGLSETGYSMQSYTNLRDYSGKERDTEDAFNSIIAALQNANSHSVNPKADISNILDIFDRFNYLNEDRTLKYSSVTIDFYIGSKFWKLGYNEKVIAQLYAVLNIEDMPKDRFNFNVFKPKSEQISYPNGMPFGELNIQNINKNIRLIEY